MKEIFPESIAQILNWYVEKNQTLGYKAGIVILLIFTALVIDNLTGFTYFYQNQQKISQFEQIRKIKRESGLDSIQRAQLDALQYKILQREDLRSTFYRFLSSGNAAIANTDIRTKIMNSTITKSGYKISLFWHVITASPFWILILMFLPFMTIYGINGDMASRLSSFFFTVISVLAAIILTSYIFWIVIPVFWFSWVQYIFNFTINILIVYQLAAWQKNGKLSKPNQ